uniref:LAGLIDADG endonuclease n=1 Tax=Morchella brunnea TaxID=1174671 RepID=A0A8K1I868_9PEZI|nr:LAGLIDADG endonuclease [Morchella brunnea]UBU98530.1 LAGLIDADG endonuclease [Morchella brunnea]
MNGFCWFNYGSWNRSDIRKSWFERPLPGGCKGARCAPPRSAPPSIDLRQKMDGWMEGLDKPKLIEARILKILCKPSRDRWSLRFIISTTCLKRSKSAHFWVNKGYFCKWLITLFNPFSGSTEYRRELFIWLGIIVPVPKKDFIYSNKVLSLPCNSIAKDACTRQPVLHLLFFDTLTIKQPSASKNFSFLI